MIQIRIPVSPEQEDVLADYWLANQPIKVLPDENVWMLAQARKLHPNCRILKAELDDVKGEWILDIDRRAPPKEVPKIRPR